MTLRFEGLSRSFRSGRQLIHAVASCSLAVEAGALVVILGPSGCGKSTLLRLLAGLDRPDAGRIFLGGRDITHLPAEHRRIGMIFQEDSLFPGMTLEQQVRWALPRSSRNAAESARLLALGGMSHLGDRYPHQLSGGERQRGALLRSLAARPEVLLLDEPFSRLDAPLRDSLRRDVKALLESTHTTAILVTHDQEEALSLADHLVVMNQGRFVQEGRPEDLYARPIDTFVARFLGRANVLEGLASGDYADTILGPLPIDRPVHGPVTLMVRPEHFELIPGDRFLIQDREFRGHDVSWRLRQGQQDILVHTDWEQDFTAGQTVDLRLRRPAVVLRNDAERSTAS